MLNQTVGLGINTSQLPRPTQRCDTYSTLQTRLRVGDYKNAHWNSESELCVEH